MAPDTTNVMACGTATSRIARCRYLSREETAKFLTSALSDLGGTPAFGSASDSPKRVLVSGRVPFYILDRSPVGRAREMSEGRVERRLAAILAADVAGYSRLMGADEEGTLAALQGAAPRGGRSQDRRASRPHRQNHRRRPAGRVRQRRRCGALRGRGAARDGRAQRRRARQSGASNSASASMSATSSSRTATSSATASTSPRGSKRWPSPAASASQRAVHDQVRDKLDVAFEDLGEQQVKNIARPVRVYRVSRAARSRQRGAPASSAAAAARQAVDRGAAVSRT